jgi:hypothetical protein
MCALIRFNWRQGEELNNNNYKPLRELALLYKDLIGAIRNNGLNTPQVLIPSPFN